MANPGAIPALKTLAFGTMTSAALCDYLDTVVANEAALAAAGVACRTASRDGPTVPLFSVRVARLPPLCQTIVLAIHNNDDKVYDLGFSDWLELKYQSDKHVKLVKGFQDSDPKFNKDMDTVAGLKAAIDDPSTKKADKVKYQTQLDKILDQTASLNPDAPGSMRSWHQNDMSFLPAQAITGDGLAGKAKLYHDYIVANKGLQNKQKKKGVAQTYTGYVEFTAGGWQNGVHDGRVCYDYVNDLFYFTATHYEQREGREDLNPWWQLMP